MSAYISDMLDAPHRLTPITIAGLRRPQFEKNQRGSSVGFHALSERPAISPLGQAEPFQAGLDRSASPPTADLFCWYRLVREAPNSDIGGSTAQVCIITNNRPSPAGVDSAEKCQTQTSQKICDRSASPSTADIRSWQGSSKRCPTAEIRGWHVRSLKARSNRPLRRREWLKACNPPLLPHFTTENSKLFDGRTHRYSFLPSSVPPGLRNIAPQPLP